MISPPTGPARSDDPSAASAETSAQDPAPDRGNPVFRFAPSPNGRLHLGHAYSALLNQRCAEQVGGTLLLRMEDLDRQRSTPAYEQGIVEDLAWLGVVWRAPVVRQSERFPRYAAVLARLEERGLVYPCFCTRGTIARIVADRPGWPRDPDGSPLYPGACRALTADERATRRARGEPAAMRLDSAAALRRLPGPIAWNDYGEGSRSRQIVAEPRLWGDVVLGRRDVPASYHLAVVIDDEAQGITDVVRGEDLFHATGLHRLLQTLLGFRAPRYHHHRLILDETGHKLSKSRTSRSLLDLRAAGETPSSIKTRLGFTER